MLFNSHEYLFLFLPLVCAVFLRLAPGPWDRALLWLMISSLVFYGWSNPANLPLLIGSLVVNYAVGWGIARTDSERPRRWLLTGGIVANLLALTHYKYAAFLTENLNAALGWQLPVIRQELPLGISFLTFQQIAYLCDVYRRRMAAHSALEYGVFVTFFPQLIAGPILRSEEVLPQFRRTAAERLPQTIDVAAGLTLFALGLFKKTVLADGVAFYSTAVFSAADQGTAPTLLEAWAAAFAYAFQLYFDFSGYTDMAIGSARLFGIRLPVNFDSPYQATSISDFWRRWHITLSTFLREFIYFPLGGSRCAAWRRSWNLFLTMLIGGLWHGAGWTFVVWGAVHGALLAVHHAWAQWRSTGSGDRASWWYRPATFLAVMFAWVLFRSSSLAVAGSMYAGLLGLNGLAIPPARAVESGFHALVRDVFLALGATPSATLNLFGVTEILMLALCGVIACGLPNSAYWIARLEAWDGSGQAWPLASRWPQLFPTACGIATGVVGFIAILRLTAVSEFVYFQF